MTLAEATELALRQGCDLEISGDGRRVTIRGIAYDADPYELELNRLFAMGADEFLRDWIPERYG